MECGFQRDSCKSVRSIDVDNQNWARKKMFIPSLDVEENLTINLLKKYVKKHKNFKLNISKFIGYNSNLDIAEEHFLALFLGESISPFCEKIS
jgi:hypothetical protein